MSRMHSGSVVKGFEGSKVRYSLTYYQLFRKIHLMVVVATISQSQSPSGSRLLCLEMSLHMKIEVQTIWDFAKNPLTKISTYTVVNYLSWCFLTFRLFLDTMLMWTKLLQL